jgi:thiamine pyrophosphate-dependent acetolactate synthase large subunit-like protein
MRDGAHALIRTLVDAGVTTYFMNPGTHLGAGLSNGLANLHNAPNAKVPVVNMVGDHATHQRLDMGATVEEHRAARS